MKKIKFILVIIGILFCIFILGFIFEIDNKYIKEYKPGTGNIKGNFDTSYFDELGPEFEVGANWHGYVVFKHPEKAARKIEEMYPDTIKLLADYTEKEFKISKKNVYAYASICRMFSSGEANETNDLKFAELRKKYPDADHFFIVNRVLNVYMHSYERTFVIN